MNKEWDNANIRDYNTNYQKKHSIAADNILRNNPGRHADLKYDEWDES